LLVLIILILLLVIGYAVRAFDGGTRSGSWPGGPQVSRPPATGPQVSGPDAPAPLQVTGWASSTPAIGG
jgi:hypothetical protein